MSKRGRPPDEEAKKHPLYGQFNGKVPWLNRCKEYERETCLDCSVPLEMCPAENPRLHKGGRAKEIKNKTKSLLDEAKDNSKERGIEGVR